MPASDRRAIVLASLKDVCEVCQGRPLELRAVPTGSAVVLSRCPHCAYRRGIPHFPLPPYQDRKRS
ncbi:MAG: hypothetical protein JWO67_4504 [Streptosporangiaceae bacterium]|nr:hypothetical protein [Streptosporangiaceae bacterium]